MKNIYLTQIALLLLSCAVTSLYSKTDATTYQMDRKGRIWRLINDKNAKYAQDPTNFDYLVLKLNPNKQYADIEIIVAGMNAIEDNTTDDEVIITAVQRIRKEQERRPNQPSDESTMTQEQKDEWDRAYLGMTMDEWLESWHAPVDEKKAIPSNIGW